MRGKFGTIPVGQLFFMTCAVLALGAFLIVEEASARESVNRVPSIAGREIPRFVLMERMTVDRRAPGLTYSDLAQRVVCEVLPGQFVPVSQDAKGVYYQSSSGLRLLMVKHGRAVAHGGLYVSKTNPKDVYVYEGDARNENEALKIDLQRVAGTKLRKLKIGRVAK